MWTHDADQLLLSLYMHDVAWLPGEALESDPLRRNKWIGAHAGIYAFKSENSVYTFVTHLIALNKKHRVIVGTVAMWGLVIEHELGYRAQFAKPLSFHSAVNISEDELNEFRVRYGLIK